MSLDGLTKPHELTHGKFGATHSPVFSNKGDKVAWLQLAKDGFEADRSVPDGFSDHLLIVFLRARVVVHDLNKNAQFTLTESWDRSPSAVVVSASTAIPSTAC